jgi:hypothetical protein
MRLGLATAVSGVVLAVVIALGGVSSPLDTAKSIVQFDNAGGSSHRGHGHGKGKHDGKPGHDQYREKVTICHRSKKGERGKTLRLPRPAAEAHLRTHPHDTLGPCPDHGHHHGHGHDHGHHHGHDHGHHHGHDHGHHHGHDHGHHHGHGHGRDHDGHGSGHKGKHGDKGKSGRWSR